MYCAFRTEVKLSSKSDVCPSSGNGDNAVNYQLQVLWLVHVVMQFLHVSYSVANTRLELTLKVLIEASGSVKPNRKVFVLILVLPDRARF